MQKKGARRKPDKAVPEGVTSEMVQPGRASSAEGGMSQPSPPTADETLKTKRLNGNTLHFGNLEAMASAIASLGPQLWAAPSLVNCNVREK